LSAEEYRELLSPPPLTDNERTPLPFSCQVGYFLDDTSRYEVYLTLELPMEGFDVQFQEGLFFVDLDVIGMVQNQNGDVITSFRGPSRFKVASQQMAFANKIKLDSQFNLAPGQYSISLSVGDPVKKRFGFQQRGLLLPEVNRQLAVSSLFIGKSDEMFPVRSEDDFTVHDVRITPSAAKRFSREDELVFLFDVYQSQSSKDNAPPELRLQTELFQNGKRLTLLSLEPLKIPVGEGSLPRVKLARFLELDGLKPGLYLLKASVEDLSHNLSRTTQTVFTVE
jgi:hypothetical protein